MTAMGCLLSSPVAQQPDVILHGDTPRLHCRRAAWSPQLTSSFPQRKQHWALNITIGDDLLSHILARNTGNARLTSIDIAYVNEHADTLGVDAISLKDWGQTPFLRGDAPIARRGLK